MTPQFKSAGISILRYVYETCQVLGVDKSEIPVLLAELSVSVAIATKPIAANIQIVLPQSNGATDRRADDQEPPKV